MGIIGKSVNESGAVRRVKTSRSQVIERKLLGARTKCFCSQIEQNFEQKLSEQNIIRVMFEK